MADQGDGERDRDRVSIAVQRRDFEQPVGIAGCAGRHDCSVAPPVPIPEALGDDQVERRSDGLGGLPSEDPCRGVVPEHDAAFGVADDHTVGEVAHEVRQVGVAQVRRVVEEVCPARRIAALLVGVVRWGVVSQSRVGRRQRLDDGFLGLVGGGSVGARKEASVATRHDDGEQDGFVAGVRHPLEAFEPRDVTGFGVCSGAARAPDRCRVDGGQRRPEPQAAVPGRGVEEVVHPVHATS